MIFPQGHTARGFALFALLVLVFCLVPEQLSFGRAGGGHSYSRSSSSSSRSSSSRSSGSSRKSDTITTSSHSFPTGRSGSTSDGQPAYPAASGRYHLKARLPATQFFQSLFLSLFFAAIALFLINSRLPRRTIPPYTPVVNAALDTNVQGDRQRKAALERIKQRDPQFSESALMKRISGAFCGIQSAWSKQDLTPVQAFLSDGVFERFSLQINDLTQDRIRDVMKGLTILDARVVKVDTETHFDSLHILIRASAVNYRGHLDTGAFIDGATDPEEFSEVWSFLRRPGAKTLQKPGLIEGACPNCSAPIQMSRAATCPACQAFLRSGEHDWVLSEITQTCEWSGRAAAEILGLKAMQAADDGFNLQHLEDRVSVIFWRLMGCYRTGRTDPLLKYATSQFLADLTKRLAPDTYGKRTSYATPAVGSVDVVLVSHQEPMDQVVVEVRWSGKPVLLDRQGKVLPDSMRPVNPHDLFVLKRQHSVKTNTRLSLSTATCPGCGAPETSATVNVCSYCNTAYNDGSREWVLDQLLKKSDQAYHVLRRSVIESGKSKTGTQAASTPPAVPTPGPIRSPADALRWMASLMCTDGTISPAEHEALKEYARVQHVPSRVLDGIVKDAQAGAALPDLPNRPLENRALLQLLVVLALRDGTVSPEELEMLTAVGKRAGISKAELQRMIAVEQQKQATPHSPPDSV